MSNPLKNLKTAATQFLMLTATGQVGEAYDLYVGPEFRHHNIYYKGDAASLREAMEESAENFPGKKLEIQFAIEEDDRVAVYSKIKMFTDDPGTALVHLFLFKNYKIVELWDLVQPSPTEIINENGLF
jgi:predicted SnoaL-like aldol condensation-catalyzing enzyme